MSPAQEGLGKLLRDEDQLQEEADGAPSQALGQASGIVDGQVVELPGEVKSALKDEGVKVRVEPKRVTEGLIGDDRGAEDGLASRRRVELRDQVEDQPCKVGEEALAGKGAEVLVAAFGVHASDAGHPLAVVAAGEEAANYAGGPLDAEVPQFLGIARIVLGRESPEMVSEHLLEAYVERVVDEV